MHLHNDIVILSLFIITLLVIVRVVIHSAAVQAAKWIGWVKILLKCFLATRCFSVLKAVIAFKSYQLHNYRYVTGLKKKKREEEKILWETDF